MSPLIRPPQKVIDQILDRLFPHAVVSEPMLHDAICKTLDGTHYRFPKIPEMVKVYRARLEAKTIQGHLSLEKLLRCKTVRTDSGVAPVTLLTKPYACPGKCVYCPTEVRMPKSYVASEPAAARALTLKFDPYLQVVKRVEAMERNGHEAKKIELIIKGGTWSAYPWAYRKWFIKRCFDGANHLGQTKKKRYTTLLDSQNDNEKSEYRIIGLTIETRPDWITPKEIERLREIGCTRVELGVQALDDEILSLTKRGHTVAETTRATVLLKSAAFKTDYHFLPGQPGSSAKKDVEMFSQMFDDARFCPDMVKIYPCVVLPSAELDQWHKEGKFKPMQGEELIEAMIQMKTRIPRYCRISRLIRDFPSHEISGGNLVTNLRDVIKERMKQRGLECKCLRCREAGHRPVFAPNTKIDLFIETYENAGGMEYFLSIEDEARTTVLGFLRLRLPNEEAVFDDAKTQKMLDEVKKSLPELRRSAFVRELHTYGQALRISEEHKDAVQHKGYGRRLMQEAEKIAKQHGYTYLSVISGIGVRGYYRDLGYTRAGTYMRKRLK